jgi:hypothetical protein
MVLWSVQLRASHLKAVWSVIRFNPDRDPRARKHQFVYSTETISGIGENCRRRVSGRSNRKQTADY